MGIFNCYVSSPEGKHICVSLHVREKHQMLFDTDACSFILSISVLVYMHEKHQMLFDTDACSFILHKCVSLHA